MLIRSYPIVSGTILLGEILQRTRALVTSHLQGEGVGSVCNQLPFCRWGGAAPRGFHSGTPPAATVGRANPEAKGCRSWWSGVCSDPCQGREWELQQGPAVSAPRQLLVHYMTESLRMGSWVSFPHSASSEVDCIYHHCMRPF